MKLGKRREEEELQSSTAVPEDVLKKCQAIVEEQLESDCLPLEKAAHTIYRPTT